MQEVSDLKHDSRKHFYSTTKKILNDQLISDELRTYIEEISGLSGERAPKYKQNEVEVQALALHEASKNTTPVEATAQKQATLTSGVYVYSYPQYLKMEAVAPDGRALYKIGASGSVDKRVERQRRQTEVPEDLVLVRVFHTEDAFSIETKIHKILQAAGMGHSSTTGGIEWFNTNLATIDAIAEALDLTNSHS